MALMVGDVDSVNLVAFRITDVAIEGTPTEPERSDKEIVEKPDVARHNGRTSYPPTPRRDTL
jgi:hypothetical protein